MKKISLVILFSILSAALGFSKAAPTMLNVLDFGADKSGAKDSTEAISKAIAAAVDGGTVFLPAGRYRISETLVIKKSGLTLLGDGRANLQRNTGGTLLLLDSKTTNMAIHVLAVSYSGVKNMGVARPDKAPIARGAKHEALIKLERSYHCFLQEILLTNPVNGLDIMNGISPLVEDLDIKNPRGDFGIWIHGSGRDGDSYRKMDATLLFRCAGSSTAANTEVNWLVIGPNVDGAKIEDGRFVGGGRALVLLKGNPEKGDVRPKYVYADRFGCDHVNYEGVVVEAGNDLFMTNTWIGQNKKGTGFVIGPDFTGPALITNIRIRGSGGHGMHIQRTAYRTGSEGTFVGARPYARWGI